MSMDLTEIKSLIKKAIPDAVIDIQDLAGDGNHYSATITSASFRGKSKIEQHKIVYKSLKGKMGNELHALAIKTLETVLKKYPDAQLTMIGPDKDLSYEKCQAYKDHKQLPVTFTGRLSKKEWTSLAKDFDIFLNTTNIDNTPLSVLEAMASSLVTISTKVGGIKYLLNDL